MVLFGRTPNRRIGAQSIRKERGSQRDRVWLTPDRRQPAAPAPKQEHDAAKGMEPVPALAQLPPVVLYDLRQPHAVGEDHQEAVS